MRLNDQQEKDIMQRYYYYISNGIDTNQVADMKNEWLGNVLKLLPASLKAKHENTLNMLDGEMREDYHMSVKKAIGKKKYTKRREERGKVTVFLTKSLGSFPVVVDFVLKDPRDKNKSDELSKKREESFIR